LLGVDTKRHSHLI